MRQVFLAIILACGGGLPDQVVAAAETVRLIATVGTSTLPLRLNVTVDGRPFDEAWSEFLARLFSANDADGNGVLSGDEAQRVPSVEWLRQQLRGDLANVPAMVMAPLGFFGVNDGIRAETFSAAYFAAGLTGVELRSVPQSPRSERVNRSLFVALAESETAPLTKQSFERADDTLRKLDLDDDEWISENELSVGLRRLTKTEVSASLRVTPPLAQNAGSTIDVRVAFTRADSSGVSMARAINGRAESTLREGVLLTIKSPGGAGEKTFHAARHELRQQFETDDANGDGRLDEVELHNSDHEATWRALLANDAQGRESLTTAIWQRRLDVLEPGAALRIEVALVDEGQPLMAQLDANHDGRLSLRELRHGWSRVQHWDEDHDWRVTWREIPRAVTLLVTRGAAQLASPSEALVRAVERSASPLWFEKMDLNGDRDLSVREFLGPLDIFNRLDRDGDRLLDAIEAAQAMAP